MENQAHEISWIPVDHLSLPVSRVLLSTATTVHIGQYQKGPENQPDSSFWKDDFGHKIEDVIAWAKLPPPFTQVAAPRKL
jgi:hypothetical protein